MTTEDDDEGVFNALRSLKGTCPPGTIGYDYITNAIDHIRKMRKEIDKLKKVRD